MDENFHFSKICSLLVLGYEMITGLTFVKCHRPTNEHADSGTKDS